MSWFSDLFTSPREREGKDLYNQSRQEYNGLISDINGTKSIYEDAGRIGNVSNAVNQRYSAARSNVATTNARARSSAARRMGSSATPEITFGNIDASFAPAYGAVEEGAQREIGGVLQNENQFGLNKLGMRGSALGGKQQAISNYLSSLSDTSTMGDILRGATSIAGIPTGKDSTLLSSLGSNLKWF